MTAPHAMGALRAAVLWGCGLALMACVGAAGAAGPKTGITAAPASQPAAAGGGQVRQDIHQANIGTVGADTPLPAAGARNEDTAAAEPSAVEAPATTTGGNVGQARKRGGEAPPPAAPSSELAWVALAFGFIGLLTAAGAAFLAWNNRRAAQDAQQAVQTLKEDIDRQLQQIRNDRERDVEKFDDDADRTGRALDELSARLKILQTPAPAPTVSLYDAPAPALHLPPETTLERQAPARMPAGRSTVAAHAGRPAPAAQPPQQPAAARATGPSAAAGVTMYRVLQEAADAALAETLHADAASFTEAVLGKVPADMAARWRQQQLRMAGHNFNANMREDFSRPDFISSVGPGGTGVLLPCRSAAYAWSYVNLYDGPMEAWPNIATPAECRLGPSGEVQMIKKGTLA